ncbi:MAG TPA: ATP-dependent DNA ligase [Dehalococcoidia bacterium]|nr:ATP-dependent DNA ligase [Dehalococcoidia bacterium]
MQVDRFVDFLMELEATSSRNRMVEVLAELFREAEVEEIDKIIYLCQGRVAPLFERLEFGVGESLAAEAVARASGKTKAEVQRLYKEKGDFGEVAGAVLPPQTTKLKVSDLFDQLYRLATASGGGAVAAKVNLLADLLSRASPRDGRLMMRIPLGKLRVGIGDPTIMDGLSYARKGDKSLRPVLERAYNICSDLGYVARLYWEKGTESLVEIDVQVGKPVRPALAERLPGIQPILDKIGRCAIEPKYDGFRCQVHRDGGWVKVFSRNLEDFSDMFPEIIEATLRQVRAGRIIFEGEAMAYDPGTGDFYPFQITVQRKRKYGIEDMRARLPLKLMAFDLLYLDGEDLTSQPYLERQRHLREALSGDEVIEVTDVIVTDDPAEFEKFFADKVQRGLEGVVCKRLDAPYQAGSRNFNWIKLKRHYAGQLRDTVDTVVLGYWRGRGARAQWGIGSLLTGVYDEAEDKFVTLARLGTGFSDEEWGRLKDELDKIAVDHKPPQVESLVQPDAWVRPHYVLEIRADEITRSPIHTCGLGRAAAGEKDIGYALRFPRAISFLRSDKGPQDATTVAEVIEMFSMQGKQLVPE